MAFSKNNALKKSIDFCALVCYNECVRVAVVWYGGNRIMANIRKRGNSYQIRVSTGYTTDGRQVTQTMTWKKSLNIELCKCYRMTNFSNNRIVIIALKM